MKSDHARQIIIRRRNTYFWSTSFCMLIALLFLGLTLDDFHDLIHGPFERNGDDLMALPASGRYDFRRETWVEVEVDAIYPISAVYSDNEGRDDGDLFTAVAQMGDYLLILRSDDTYSLNRLNSLRMNGELWGTGGGGAYEYYYHEVRNEFRQHYPDVNAIFLPVTIDVSTDALEEFLKGGLIGVPALIIGLVLLWNGVQITRNPNRTPIMKRFRNYGDPQDVLEQIEYEMKHKRIPNISDESYCLTQNWLIYSTRFGSNYYVHEDFFAMRYVDIMLVQKRRWKLDIFDRYGKSITIESLQADIIKLLHRETPWAAWDNSKETSQFWIENREEFINNVDEVRRSMTNSKKNK